MDKRYSAGIAFLASAGALAVNDRGKPIKNIRQPSPQTDEQIAFNLARAADKRARKAAKRRAQVAA